MNWIKVTEPPKKNGYGFINVLVALGDGSVRQAMYNNRTMSFMYTNFDLIGFEVTHWMPLPEPPTEKGEKK